MWVMSKTLHPYVGKFVVFFDNILVYSRDHTSHLEHLWVFFTTLCDMKLYASPSKCFFFVSKVIFLGYGVSSDGLKPDERKIKAIQEWKTPTSISQVLSFHGLASFY